MEKSYIEEQTLIFPNIENGPGALGDLWNCHTSQFSGFNLFGKNLQAHHLIVDPRQNLSYTLTHVRNLKDKTREFSIGGEISVEILSGFIKVSGSGDYEKKTNKNSLDEELLCNYYVETFQVRTLPSAKEANDQFVAEKLIKGELKATHIVNQIVLGGEATASITIKCRDSSKNKAGSLELLGNLPLGKVSASAKATLSILDQDQGNEFNMRIILQSKPPIKSPPPESIGTMFSTIESFNDNISQEKHFPLLNSEDLIVIGVPLRYHLVPIGQYMENIPVQKLYLSIKDNILSSFLEMLTILNDLQTYDFIKKKILENDPRIRVILSDDENPYTMDISTKEIELKCQAREFFLKSTQVLKLYKLGRSTINELIHVNEEFSKVLDTKDIDKLISNYLNEGKGQLKSIKYNEIDEKIQILTNENSIDDFISSGKGYKIILKTDGAPPSVFSIYELSSKLAKNCSSLAIVLPNISKEFSLSFNFDDNCKVFHGSDVLFAIKGLSVFLNSGNEFCARFFKIISSIKGLNFEENGFKTFPSVIHRLKEYSYFKIIDNSLDLYEFIIDEENKDDLIFVLPIESVYSSYEAISSAISHKENFPGGKWIIGNFEFHNESDAPLLLIFSNGRFVTSIFDNLDYLVAIDMAKHNSLEKLGNVLGKNFIHYDKSRFENFLRDKFKETKLKLPNNYSINHKFDDVLSILVSIASSDEFKLLSSMMKILKKYSEDIYDKYLGHKMTTPINSENVHKWREFQQAIQDQVNFGEFYSKQFIQILNQYIEQFELNSSSINIFTEQTRTVLNDFIEQIEILPAENLAPNWKVELNEMMEGKHFHLAINFLSKLQFSKKIIQIQNEINSIHNLQDPNLLVCVLQNLKKIDLTLIDLAGLFECPKFLYWINNFIDNVIVLNSIKNLVCIDDEIPDYLKDSKEEFVKKLQKILNKLSISEFSSMKIFLDCLRLIIKRKFIPNNFQSILEESVKIDNFKYDMLKYKIDFNWNRKDNAFEKDWDMDDILEACSVLEKSYSEQEIEILVNENIAEKPFSGKISTNPPIPLVHFCESGNDTLQLNLTGLVHIKEIVGKIKNVPIIVTVIGDDWTSNNQVLKEFHSSSPGQWQPLYYLEKNLETQSNGLTINKILFRKSRRISPTDEDFAIICLNLARINFSDSDKYDQLVFAAICISSYVILNTENVLMNDEKYDPNSLELCQITKHEKKKLFSLKDLSIANFHIIDKTEISTAGKFYFTKENFKRFQHGIRLETFIKDNLEWVHKRLVNNRKSLQEKVEEQTGLRLTSKYIMSSDQSPQAPSRSRPKSN